ncbi:hypothetical protein [Haladaptatus sp. NG-WS-4]
MRHESAADQACGTTDENLHSLVQEMLIDKNTILVVSVHETDTGGVETEKAVFGRGFDNVIVVIARRLMATGLPRRQDPDVTEGE